MLLQTTVVNEELTQVLLVNAHAIIFNDYLQFYELRMLQQLVSQLFRICVDDLAAVFPFPDGARLTFWLSAVEIVFLLGQH